MSKGTGVHSALSFGARFSGPSHPTKRLREAVGTLPGKQLPTTLQGTGWGMQEAGQPFPTTPGDISTTLTQQQFKDWYDQYVKFGVTDPVKTMAGTGLHGRFREVTPEEKKTMGLFSRYTGDYKWLPKEIGEPAAIAADEAALSEAQDAYDFAQWQYDENLKAAKEELVGLTEEKGLAKKEYEAEKRALSGAREQVSAGGAFEAQAEQAAQAKSGFAYSAPAKMTAEELGTTSEGLEEIAASELEIRKGYKETVEGIAGREEEVELDKERYQKEFGLAAGGLETAKALYGEKLASEYGQAVSALGAIGTDVGKLIQAHTGMQVMAGGGSKSRRAFSKGSTTIGAGGGLLGTPESDPTHFTYFKEEPTTLGGAKFPGQEAEVYFMNKRIREADKIAKALDQFVQSGQVGTIPGTIGYKE